MIIMINYIEHHQALSSPPDANFLAQFLQRIALLTITRANILTGPHQDYGQR